MNEYKGISMFKVSKEQHRRLLVSLWVMVVLTVIRSCILPLLPIFAGISHSILLQFLAESPILTIVLDAAVVVCECVILNELRVALRRIAHWGQWICVVVMVGLALEFISNSVFIWFEPDPTFYFSTPSAILSYLQKGSSYLLFGAWFVLVCILFFTFSGRLKDTSLALLALLIMKNVGEFVFTTSFNRRLVVENSLVGVILFFVSLLFYYYIYKCFETTKNPQE